MQCRFESYGVSQKVNTSYRAKYKMKQNRNWSAIQDYYDNNHSSREVLKHFKMSNLTFLKAVRDGLIITRSKSEATKLAAIKFPRKYSVEQNEKRSAGMKKAHQDGRAWNIGGSRWNNQPSYPEIFFMKVIKNEFLDQNYIREYPFGKFSLDFAWLHLQKCIEIDGEQHERFESQKQRDQEKDSILIQNGWKVLRIKWKDLFHNPKEWIMKAKKFIEN